MYKQSQKSKNRGREKRSRKIQALARLCARNATYKFSDIDDIDAVLTYAILSCSDSVWVTGSFSGNEPKNVCPSSALFDKVLARLFRRGILQISSNTNVSAIELAENGNSAYYPAKAVWQLTPDVDGLKLPQLLEEFSKRIDELDGSLKYNDVVGRLWWTVGLEDVSEFLRAECYSYRLSLSYEGEKLQHALKHGLRNLSIPCFRRKIKHVVSGAAALAQKRTHTSSHAANTIHGNLVKFVDRTVAESWEVYPVLRDWQQEECFLMTLLFDRILGGGQTSFKVLSGSELVELLGF